MSKMTLALALSLASFSAPALADDSALIALFDGDGPTVTDGVPTKELSAPGNPGDPDAEFTFAGIAKNTRDGISPLADGQRCTGDPRCSGEPEIASGTGRGEQYYHYTLTMTGHDVDGSTPE